MSGAKGMLAAVNFLKSMGKIVVLAAVAATVLTALLVVTGTVGIVPPVRFVWLRFTIPSWFAAWSGLFVNLLLVGIVYTFFGSTIVEKFGEARDGWSSLPPAGKALLAGIPFALVAGLAVAATHLLAFALSAPVRFVVPILAWLAVAAASFAWLRSADRLAPLLNRFAIGTGIGAGFAAVTILLGRFGAGLSLPGYLPLLVFLVTAPLAAAVLVRSAQRDDGGYLAALLVRTGFAQVRKIKSLTVALALGLLVAVLAALLVSAVADGLLPTLLAFLLAWLLATAGALRWFQRTDVAYGDLVIVDVRDRSSGSRRELAVTNQRDERVDLRNAKIRDTEYDLYRTNIDVLLGPGQTETFDIPPNFSLFPSTDDVANDLPLGFSVSQSADAPVIVTRDGKKFKLRWAEGVAEAAGFGDPSQQRALSPEAERREDNV